MPAWGPPSSLSPLKVTRSAPARIGLLHRCLALQSKRLEIDEASAPEVFDYGQPALASQSYQFVQPNLFGKAQIL